MNFRVSPNRTLSFAEQDRGDTILDLSQRPPWQIGTWKLPKDNRTMYRMDADLYKDGSGSEITIATLPTSLSSYLLLARSNGGNMSSPAHQNGTTFTMQSIQPLVITSCSSSASIYDEQIYSIDKSKKLLVGPRALFERLVLNNRTFESAEESASTEASPEIWGRLWSPAADDPHTLIVLELWYGPAWDRSQPASTWRVCTVDAFWWRARTSLVTINGILQVKPEMPDLRQPIPTRGLRPITFNNNVSETYLHPPFANGLAFVFVDALANLPYAGSIPYEDLRLDEDWAQEAERVYKGFDISQLEGQSDIIPFRIETVDYGYGYGTRDIPTNLSVAVITAYCLIVVFYIGYVITTGHASIAWNSPTELIILALQSKEPADLGHVSVGVDSVDTLRRSVGIRVSTEAIQGTGETKEKLELVFEDDEENEKRGLTKVVRNRAY